MALVWPVEGVGNHPLKSAEKVAEEAEDEAEELDEEAENGLGNVTGGVKLSTFAASFRIGSAYFLDRDLPPPPPS